MSIGIWVSGIQKGTELWCIDAEIQLMIQSNVIRHFQLPSQPFYRQKHCLYFDKLGVRIRIFFFSIFGRCAIKI